jgi:hypothetical protein
VEALCGYAGLLQDSQSVCLLDNSQSVCQLNKAAFTLSAVEALCGYAGLLQDTGGDDAQVSSEPKCF